VLTAERFTLLERLAERLAEVTMADARIEAVTVAVRKLRPPVPQQLDTTGVRIRRARP
jgi:dihydroneopterin aldolase